MKKIDVVLVTAFPNLAILDACICCIAKNSLLGQLIVVLPAKDDVTTQYLRNSKRSILVIHEPVFSCLAYARYLGIQAVVSEYFVFIDSDVLIPRRYLLNLKYVYELLKETEEEIFVLEGRLRPVNTSRFDCSVYQIASEIIQAGGRGFTHNTFFRTADVRGWIPMYTHAWEDYLLTQHIQKKGGRWFRTPIMPAGYHIREYSTRKRIRWGTAGERMTRGITRRSLICSIKNRWISEIKKKNAFALIYALIFTIGRIEGYMQYTTYLPKRKNKCI